MKYFALLSPFAAKAHLMLFETIIVISQLNLLKIKINFKFILFFLLASISITQILINYPKTGFSTWQLIRTFIPFLMTLTLILIYTEPIEKQNTKTIKKNQNLTIHNIYLIAILTALGITISAEFLPALIITAQDKESQFSRIYTLYNIAALPVYWYAMQNKKIVLGVITILLIALTQGRVIIASMLILTAIYYSTGPIRKGLAIAILTTILIYTLFSLNINIETTEFVRYTQVIDAWSLFTNSTLSIMFGIGHGIPYSEGYVQYGILPGGENTNEIINSMYDVENFFSFLLLRHGLVGTFIYVLLLFQFLKSTSINVKTWLIVIAILCTGGAIFATYGGVIFIYTLRYFSQTRTHDIK